VKNAHPEAEGKRRSKRRLRVSPSLWDPLCIPRVRGKKASIPLTWMISSGGREEIIVLKGEIFRSLKQPFSRTLNNLGQGLGGKGGYICLKGGQCGGGARVIDGNSQFPGPGAEEEDGGVTIGKRNDH